MLTDIECLACRYIPEEEIGGSANYMRVLFRIDSCHNMLVIDLTSILTYIISDDVNSCVIKINNNFIGVYFNIPNWGSYKTIYDTVKFETTYKGVKSCVELKFCNFKEMNIKTYMKISHSQCPSQPVEI